MSAAEMPLEADIYELEEVTDLELALEALDRAGRLPEIHAMTHEQIVAMNTACREERERNPQGGAYSVGAHEDLPNYVSFAWGAP